MESRTDAVVIGAGLAGLVAAYELMRAGKHVTILEQETEENLGGQAFWSLGGLFFIDSPEQRRMGIKDSSELALQDWMGSAQFDRITKENGEPGEDFWGEQWARAYVNFAHHEKRAYLRELGLRSIPVVGWAERGDGRADGHGNSVPRFHITWGTGPRVVEIFAQPLLQAQREGKVTFKFRHRVTELITENGAVVGAQGEVLHNWSGERGTPTPRQLIDTFEIRADATVVTTGGIGHNFDLMRKNWPTQRSGAFPKHLIAGVPAHVDGAGLGIAERAGARIVNRDRMWAYTEGIHNWAPVWPGHAIRILPGPSSMWFDANGKRMVGMSGVPGADSVGGMGQVLAGGYDYSWFILNTSIISREFVLSGSEQNPDMTGRSLARLVKDRVGAGAPPSVQKFIDHGEDFVTADNLEDLVAKMNELSRGPQLEAADIRRQIEARDREIDNPFTKDIQVMVIHNARKSLTDKILRVAEPHKILDPQHGPLIGVRLNILSRKTLGGIQTDLQGRAVGPDGQVVPGLFAAGEAAGFGGGGVHGYNSLEGTFLGGCIFSGRQTGRGAASEI